MIKVIIATLAVSALTVPSVAAASDDVTGSGISVTGREHRHGWLTTIGPDSQGRYTAWIDIADLDAATTSGWSKMNSRARLGTALLCDLAAEQPQIDGFYNAGERACWSNALTQAADQMTAARNAARSGRHVARLGFAFQSPTH